MKSSLKSLIECVIIFICGVGAVSAVAQTHWSADIGWICTALILATMSFLRYRDNYNHSNNEALKGKRAEGYAVDLLKSFMLFTCGEGSAFSLLEGHLLVGSLFMLSTVLICGLVYHRDSTVFTRAPE